MGPIIISAAMKQIFQHINYSNIMGLLQLNMHKVPVTTEVRCSFNLLTGARKYASFLGHVVCNAK